MVWLSRRMTPECCVDAINAAAVGFVDIRPLNRQPKNSHRFNGLAVATSPAGEGPADDAIAKGRGRAAATRAAAAR